MSQIELIAVSMQYPAPGGAAKSVLRDLSLVLRSDRFTAIVGPNGCGKTTLLGVVAGLLAPTAGTVNVPSRGDNGPQVGYVWQDYRSSLLPWMSAAENVAFPLRIQGIARAERRRIVSDMMREFLPAVSPNKACYELSGGQQQLLCLMRSAISLPDVLLFDEPFSALDQQRRWAMASYVERIWQKVACPVLFVSHDVDEAVLLADDILLMNRDGSIGGRVTNDLGRPRGQQVLTHPAHTRCRDEIIEFLLGQAAPNEPGDNGQD